MALGTQMQQRRATEAAWTTSDYVLEPGELGVTTDTGIIKIGNGTTPWSGLDPAFDSHYLPILGKAADSELLDGISADFFVKFADTSTDPDPDTFVQRLSNGRIKGATATDADDLTTLAQQTSAITTSYNNSLVAARQEVVSRTVTGNITFQTTDVGAMIFVNNSSVTTQITVTAPTNAIVAIPVGSWIDICTIGAGGAKLLAAGGVTLSGSIYVFPNYSVVRALKTATDAWILIPIAVPNPSSQVFPKMRVNKTTVSTYNTGGYRTVPYDSVDTSETYNPDNEWFSIPSPDLPTAQRIIVNKTGEYTIEVNFAGAGAFATVTRISKYTANGVSGDTLAMGAATQFFNLTWRGELTAGESIGTTHGVFSGTNDTDQVNSASVPHNLRIFLSGAA